MRPHRCGITDGFFSLALPFVHDEISPQIRNSKTKQLSLRASAGLDFDFSLKERHSILSLSVTWLFKRKSKLLLINLLLRNVK